MNERIKELASQVLDELVPETWTALKYDKIKEIQFRTAELIVRECAELTLDHKSDDYYNGWLDYRDEIKRHFGVEE
jgi:hypothetical protein